MFCMPEFPENNTFLSPEETEIVLRRIEEDRGDAIADALTASKVFEHLMDWKIWVFGT